MRALLEPLGVLKGVSVTDQDDFDASSANRSFYEALDKRYAGPNFRNLLRQLESLRRVGALWRAARVLVTARLRSRAPATPVP